MENILRYIIIGIIIVVALVVLVKVLGMLGAA